VIHNLWVLNPKGFARLFKVPFGRLRVNVPAIGTVLSLKGWGNINVFGFKSQELWGIELEICCGRILADRKEWV
jgi:hypothetical protein